MLGSNGLKCDTLKVPKGQMALLAEEIVEEWLRRDGYFTIRGIKLGVHEVDLLAVRPNGEKWECRHVEVQASINPVSYLSRVPAADQKAAGLKSTSRKLRTDEQLKQGIQEWIAKKFDHPAKVALMDRLVGSGIRVGPWKRELVVHRLAFEQEATLLEESGVRIIRLSHIVQALRSPGGVIAKAGGADFLDLLLDDFVT